MGVSVGVEGVWVCYFVETRYIRPIALPVNTRWYVCDGKVKVLL